MKRLVTVLAVLASLGSSAQAQRPAFEAAAIKRNVSGASGSRAELLPGGRVVLTNGTVRGMIRNFFKLQDYQIAGGPAWLSEAHWDIVAKADPQASTERAMEMMQTLLADTFKLVTHYETREMPVYALTPARADGRVGPNLRASSVDCAAYDAAQRAPGAVPPPPGATPVCGSNSSEGKIRAGARTMVDFARTLSVMTGRAVVDRTGLTGVFDVDLTWTPEPPAGAPSSADPARPLDDRGSLFTAVQEQLGLKLEAQRGPVNVLVIDSAELPVED